MNKKATLLIKNLETIYTMQMSKKTPLLYHHSFIAIHHESIIGIGEGDFSSWIDKDTRIIDAYGHFAIPAFIECDAHMQIPYVWESMRIQLTRFQNNARKGILNTNVTMTPKQEHICSSYYFTLYEQLHKNTYPIVYGKQTIQKKTSFQRKRFCLSTYDPVFAGDDLLLLARMMKLRFQIDDYTLLKAMTIYPAKALSLHHIGILNVGKQADILIVNGRDISTLFTTFDEYSISHVIKKGVRIFPNILI